MKLPNTGGTSASGASLPWISNRESHGRTKRKYSYGIVELYTFVYLSTPNWSKSLVSTGVQSAQGVAIFVVEYNLKPTPLVPPTPFSVRFAPEMTGKHNRKSSISPLA